MMGGPKDFTSTFTTLPTSSDGNLILDPKVSRAMRNSAGTFNE